VFKGIQERSVITLVELPDMPEWMPEDALFMIYVLIDTTGKALKHEFDPASLSGDWSASFTHYFDEQERTMKFEFYSGSFNSFCTDILRIRITSYFDRKFKLLKHSVSYTDKDNHPINNAEQCDTYGIEREPHKIYRNYKDVLEQTARDPYLHGQ
jgi:molybdenum cofactor biosynthesis enzyme MoaA